MTDKTMISCIAWLKKGYAKADPKTNDMIDLEMAGMMEEEELMEEAKKYKEKYEQDEDIPSIP